MDWFLYDNGLCHERVNNTLNQYVKCNLDHDPNHKNVVLRGHKVCSERALDVQKT